MPIAQIQENDRRERFVATAGQTVFPYDFPIYAATDLQVRRERSGVITTLTYGADYSVAGVQNQTGGNVVLTAGATLNDIIVILSAMPSARTGQFVNGGDLSAAALEAEFNRIRILIQQNFRDGRNALLFPPTDPTMQDLPPLTQRANRFLAFDTNGQPYAATPAAGTVLDAISRLGDNMAGRFGFQPGSAALPGLTPNNDNFSGLFSPGAGIIGVAINGVEASRFIAGGLRTQQTGTGAVARAAEEKLRDIINVRDYGAIGNGIADDYPAIQAAVNASNGNTVHVPAGQYRLTAPIAASQSISILGVGNGAGPGGAEQGNSQVTQFLLDFASPSAFVVTNTSKPCLFADFQINVNPAWRTAGAGRGISISAPIGTGTNANTKIKNVAFNWLHTPIYAYKPAWWTIEGCYFGNWTNDAIFSETQAGIEGSLGWVRRNYFFGNTTASQRSCIYLRNGYAIISENEILGTQYGIQVDIANHPAGFIKIINNTIEEQYYAGIYFSGTDANDLAMVDLSGNEFSSVATAASYTGSIWIGDGPARQWLQDVTIKNNITRNSGVCSLGQIRVGAGANVMVSGNMLENIGGTAVTNGIIINGTASNAALAAQIAVLDNMFRGSFTNRYLFFGLGGTGVILRDLVAMTVAQIPVNTANGSEIYASDGRGTALGNYTLIAGGTGAKAFRQRGAWLTPGDLL